MHLHRTGALPFNHAVCNADGRCIIAMDRGFQLRMSHISKDAAKNNAGLEIVEQSPQFCLGCGSNNESNDICTHVEGAINADWGVVLGHPPHEKMPASLTVGLPLR